MAGGVRAVSQEKEKLPSSGGRDAGALAGRGGGRGGSWAELTSSITQGGGYSKDGVRPGFLRPPSRNRDKWGTGVSSLGGEGWVWSPLPQCCCLWDLPGLC